MLLEKIRTNQYRYEQGTERFRKILTQHTEEMRLDAAHYYDEKADLLDQKHYYRKVEKHPAAGPMLFYLYHDLMQKTHKNQLPYHISKNQYLYTWVDLHPDGTVYLFGGSARSA